MAITEQERRAYGWLGKPPDEVMMAPSHIVKRWKQLNKRANQVASMRYSQKKVDLAKSIEREYNGLAEEARGYLNEQRN